MQSRAFDRWQMILSILLVLSYFICYPLYLVWGVMQEDSPNSLVPLAVVSSVFYVLSLVVCILYGVIRSKKYFAFSTVFWVLAILSQLVEHIPVFSLRRILSLILPWGIFLPTSGTPILIPIEPVLTVLIFALIHHLIYWLFSLHSKKGDIK